MMKSLITSVSALSLVVAAGAVHVSAQDGATDTTILPEAAQSDRAPLRLAQASDEAAEEGAEATAEEEERTPEEALREAAEAVTAEVQPQVEGEWVVQPENTYLSSNLIGQPVQNLEGENLADVDSLVITPDGLVTHVIVSFGGFLGFGKKQVLLPWAEFAVDAEDRVFTLAMTQEEIEALPEFITLEERQRQEEAAQATPPAGGLGTGGGMGTAPTQPAQ